MSDPLPLASRNFAASDPVTPAPLDSAYKFSLLDTLSIKVFKMEDLLVIESGKTRTRAVHEAVERIDGVGAHNVGTTRARSADEVSDYGYRFYQYNAVGDKRNQIVLTRQQAEG